MSLGICRLCLEVAHLENSHLLPKSLYKLIKRADGGDDHPVVVSRETALETSKQVSDYLLCKNCEHRFNVGGEKWIIENCWRNETEFPIQEALHAFTPEPGTAVDLAAYRTDGVAGVEPQRLVFFAASVFWRAAAHHWGGPASYYPVRLDLGPYREELRLYLLNQSPLPSNVVITVTVGRSRDSGENNFMIFPWLYRRQSEFRQYRFVVPGIAFQMIVGKGIPPTLRALCTWRSTNHLVYTSDSLRDSIMDGMARLASKAAPKGRLK